MGPLKILQVPNSIDETHRKELLEVCDYLIVRCNDPSKVFWSRENQVQPLSKEEDYSEYIIGHKNEIRIRIYESFNEASSKKLCEQLKITIESEKPFLIIVQCMKDADRDSFFAIYEKSPLKEMVILTNRNEGDISFMPYEAFQKSKWVVTNIKPAENVTGIEKEFWDMQNEIFNNHINYNLIRFKVAQIRELLSPNKLGKLSVSAQNELLKKNKNKIGKLLDDIDSLKDLINKDCEKKAKYAENSYWSIRSDQQTNSEEEIEKLKVYAKVFLAIRNASLSILNANREHNYQCQIIKYAARIANGTSYEFLDVAKELLGPNWRNFETISLGERSAIPENINETNDLIVNLLKEKIDCEDFIQTLESRAILEEVNKWSSHWEKIKSTIHGNEFITEQNDLLAIAKEVLRDGMNQALDGKISILDTFLEEVAKLYTLDADLKDLLRKVLTDAIFKYDQATAFNVYKDHCAKTVRSMPEILVEFQVNCYDDWALEMTSEEIQKTFYTGKWAHSGPDYISKRMVHSYFHQPNNKLLARINLMFQSFEIPSHVKRNQLRMKCYEWREEQLEYAFRPIAMSTQFINIIDKAVCNRLLDWESNNHIIPPLSFAYQKRKSPLLCQFKLLHKVADLSRSEGCWYPISLDFKQAFENVNPTKLCQIMANKGIPSKIISWVWYRLQSRELHMVRDGEETVFHSSSGVPQGSALSPLLFNIYVAHIHDIVQEQQGIILYQYADDLLILATGSDFSNAQRNAENICFEVIKSMNKYDAKLKSKSVDEVSFVGIKMKIPKNENMCKNLVDLFSVYFEDLERKIKKRMESLKESNFCWDMYVCRIRPLFSKTFISLEILQKASPGKFMRQVSTFGDLRRDCLKKYLGLNDLVCSEIALLCESGEFSELVQMEVEYEKAYMRFKYYGHIDDRGKNQRGQIALPGNISIVRKVPNQNEYTYIVYTDGSALKLDDGSRRSGAGVYFKKPTDMGDPSKRLRDDIMIGTSEMVALVIALKYIEAHRGQNQEPYKILICFDRMEVMLQLNRSKTRHMHKYAEEIKKIALKLAVKGVEIHLKKVKGHQGKDNAEADKRAKLAARNNPIDEEWELSLVDDLRATARKGRKKFEENLKDKKCQSDEGLQEYFKRVNNDTYVFCMKPWFRLKRVRVLQLSTEDIQKYIKDRLVGGSLKKEELKEWKYYYPGYANENHQGANGPNEN